MHTKVVRSLFCLFITVLCATSFSMLVSAEDTISVTSDTTTSVSVEDTISVTSDNTTSVSAKDMIQINSLIEKARTNDGRQVTITGEVIGESMQRGEYCWVNIKDSTNAMGVWMKLADAKQIRYYGHYGQNGDIVSITGIFHRACVEHGGEADIHCEKLTILETGFSVVHKVTSEKVLVAGGLFLILLATGTIVYLFVIHTKKHI